MDRTNSLVSFIIPVHNQAHLLKKLIRSIVETAGRDIRYEIVVTDDGSREPVEKEIPPLPDLKFVRHASPQGAAAARNASVAASKGDLLFFLDADTMILPGAISRVVERFKNDPELGALNGGGALDPANPEDGFTAQYRAMTDHVQLNIRSPEISTLFTPRCGVIRRRHFEAAGGFNSKFKGASVEEYEFGYRLNRITPIRFDPNVSVLHHYSRFWKNAKHYLFRVRMWMHLFHGRKKFDSLGSCTGSAGAGSIAGVLWIPCLFLPSPVSTISALICLAAFAWGYRDIFYWSARLKGPVFFAKTVALTWWLCFMIVIAAGLGTIDYLTGKSTLAR